MAREKAKRVPKPPITIRIPVMVYVEVPIFEGRARFSDLDGWARQRGFVLDLTPRVEVSRTENSKRVDEKAK